jgi:hypothetical protein
MIPFKCFGWYQIDSEKCLKFLRSRISSLKMYVKTIENLTVHLTVHIMLSLLCMQEQTIYKFRATSETSTQIEGKWLEVQYK